MFERLGSWTYRLRFLIVLAWVAGAIAMRLYAPSIAGTGSADQASFLPPSAPSVVARDALETAFPGSTSTSSATITLRRDGGLTADDQAYRDAFAAWVVGPDAPADLRRVTTGTETADSRPELASMLRSPDGGLELLIVNMNVGTGGDEAAAVVGELRARVAATAPAGLEVHVTGSAAIATDYLDAIKAGTESTTIWTVALVVLVLLLIYRAPLAALVPLLTIGLAWMVARGVLGILAGAGWQISSLLDTFIVVMVFGVGTDYAIFLISRYREEIGNGDGDWHEAARRTLARIGAVITASAATVIVGMTAMGAGDFQMIASTGPGLAISIAVTLLAGLTLTPALLSIFGHFLFWPLHLRQAPEGEPRGFFARLASGVSRRPGLVTLVMVVALVVPSLFLPQVKTNFDVLAELPKSADSRVGFEQVADLMGEDKLVQSTALVATAGGDVLAPAQLARLRDLVAGLHGIGGVATTTSLVTPEGGTTVPDAFVPSKNLVAMADAFAGDDAASGSGTASLLADAVKDGLDQALAYVDGLAAAFPDLAGGAPIREARARLTAALDVIERVRQRSVLSTQLRGLASSLMSPTGAGSGGSALMRDYLAELLAAYPEVENVPGWTRMVAAADALATAPTVAAVVELSGGLQALAQHFDARPGALFSPKSLADTDAAKALRAEATRAFDAIPGALRGLSDAFAGRSDDLWVPTTLTGAKGADVRELVDAFVSQDGTATRFYVTAASDPYSGDAFAVIRAVRDAIAAAAPAFGAAAVGAVSGPTAQFADVQDTLASDFDKVAIITVIGIVIVLILLLRAIVAPLYLVATVMLSYGSAVGIAAFLFQEVLGQAGISFYLPLMVFVLLVALGSDYNIFLMHRVREESERRPIRDGVRIASGHTGAVITSAGLVLAGTFGSMATAPLVVLFQVGVAVAIGVLIDTFLVRSVLVPAITALVGDRAWWPSRRVGPREREAR